jgi:hypothetical protein
MGGLFVNHIMIYFHRTMIRSDENLEDAINGVLVKDMRTPRIPLWRHRFAIVDADGRSYRYSVTARISVIASLSVSFFLVLIGSVLPLMVFEFKGLAGLAIAFIDNKQSRQEYSLITIGTSIIDGAPDDTGGRMGVVLIQILYLLFAFFVPLLTLAGLGALWVSPLTLKEQLKLQFVCEILYCWDSLIVLVISVIACIFQVSQLAQFIVLNATGTFCSAITAPLDFLFPNNSQDNKCFDVLATLAPTSPILFIACVLAIISMAVAFRLAFAAIDDREHAMRRKVPTMPGDMRGLGGFLVRRSLEAFGTPAVGGGQANMMVTSGSAMLTPSVAYGSSPIGDVSYGMPGMDHNSKNFSAGAFLTPSMGYAQDPSKGAPPVIAPRTGAQRVAPSFEGGG